MEPPFLVLRSGGQVLSAVPIQEFFRLQKVARVLMQSAVYGDPNAKEQVETVFAQANDPSHPEFARSFIATFLLNDALLEAREMRAQYEAWAAMQPAQEQQAQPQPTGSEAVPECPHGLPVFDPCAACQAAKVSPLPKTEAA